MKQKTLAWWQYVLPPGILYLITAFFYYPSLRYYFLFDDLPNITRNHAIRSLTPEGLFFANSRWLSRLLNQLTYHHWKLDPFAYRVIDLLIHLIAGTLLFFLVLTICRNVKKHDFLQKHPLLLATLTSGLFLLHPVQTQTVTYITQIRLEGLVVVFSFAILLIFVRATLAKHTHNKSLLYLLCGLLVIFAAGTKEIIVVLPMLLLLVDWFFLSEGDYRIFVRRLPIHAVLSFLLYYTYLKFGFPIKPTEALGLKVSLPNNRGNILTQTAQEVITPLKYLTGQFRVIIHYLSMFFWPLGLSFDYGWKIPPSFWSIQSLLPFLTLMGIFLSTFLLFIKNQINIICFSLAWFFISVLPRATIVPSTEFVCDYKTYLASFGILFLIAVLLTRLITVIKIPAHALLSSKPITQFALAILLCTTLGVATQQRNKVWSSRIEFWKDVINKTEPHTSARAYNNYAVGLVEAGRREEALLVFQKAIDADKTYAEPVINLALQYQAKGDDVNAMYYYKHALTLKERHPEMFNNLGLLHFKQKSYDKAIYCFKTAIKLRKYYGRAFFNLARTYQMQNNLKEALVYYEAALNSDYQRLDFYHTHGVICYRLKEYARAIPSLEHVEAQHKNYKDTRSLLANCYYNTSQPAKSSPYFKFLHEQKPQDALYCYNYAQSLLQTKQYEKALPLFIECENDKRLVHTPLHIAKCMHHLGKTRNATAKLTGFIKNNPSKMLQKMASALLKELG